MSKPRYNWWSFALAIIRDYPQRRKALEELRQQKLVADNNGMPGGGGASRTAENTALLQLPPQEQREYEAVHKALARTRARKDGSLRMEVIKLTMWRDYTIPGAAIITKTTETTARTYRWQFIMLVGHTYGFLSKEEYETAIRKKYGN